jgi:hypothetical protein
MDNVMMSVAAGVAAFAVIPHDPRAADQLVRSGFWAGRGLE